MRRTFKKLTGHGKKDQADIPVTNNLDENEEYVADSTEAKLQLLNLDGSESLWQQAWERTKEDPNCQLPVQWPLDSLKANNEAESVAREARARAENAPKDERAVGNSKYTYRQVYGNIANYAQKFQSVGDLLVQADPGYATLPWTLIRFCISIAASEDETYHRMLDGTGYVSQLVVQYSVIEKTYARIDSELATEVRKTLFNLYLSILRFQVFAIRYFDQDEKTYRTLKGINPISAADIKAQLEAIKATRDQADHGLILVHADVTKRGIEDVSESLDVNQKEILGITRDGILTLARRTATSFEDQKTLIEGKFTEIEARNQERHNAILELWNEPLAELSNELQQQQIHREEEELKDLRHWLSRAKPEANYQEARTKRPFEELGSWLLGHPHFQAWERSEKSSILWMYGFAGSGKTSLVCLAIDHLRKAAERDNGRFTFFFCSSDQSDPGTGDYYSRSDPAEALRSIVSRLSTSANTRSAAAIVQEMYKDFGPGSDTSRPLSYDDCTQIICSLAKDMPIVIVLDAFDELNRNSSPGFLLHLKSIISQCPEGRIKVFISTRSFPAIENELNPDDGVEVTTENNGSDVKVFVAKALEEQIQRRNLLQGEVSEQLKAEIRDTLTSRARNMFLYASLLLNQICDPNSNDDEDDVRRKLDKLPSSITAVYDGVMDQIHDSSDNSSRTSRIAQETFKWLLRAQATLLSDFLIQAISSIEGPTNDTEIQRACRTLVVKGRASDRDTFEFAHYSVREHISKMDEYSPSKCHVVALKGCLRTLNTTFQPSTARPNISERQKLFCDYALLYWPLHYEGISSPDMEENAGEINSLLRSFLVRGRNRVDKYAAWFPKAQELAQKLQDNESFIRKLSHLETENTPPMALFAACVFGINDLIGQYGRDPGGLNKTNGNALQAAAANGHIDVINLLLENKPPALVDTPGGYYGSALMAAICSGNADVVWALLEERSPPNLSSKRHGMPLEKAASMGQSFKEIVSLLLDVHAKADMTKKGASFHLLQKAARYNMIDLAEYCLKEGCPINMVTTEGPTYHRRFGDFPNEMTPLGYACAEGHVEMVELLLGRGAAVGEGKDPSAVLWTAAYQGHPGVVRLLLDYSKTKHTPEERARFMAQRPHPKAGHWVMFAAASSSSPDTVSALIKHGVEYKANWFGATPLFATATFGRPQVCNRLLEHHKKKEVDVRMNQPQANGRTALHEAVIKCRHNILPSLLKAGADFLRNYAKHIEVLIDHGANWMIPGIDGDIPLNWAAKHGHDSSVNMLLSKLRQRNTDIRLFRDHINHLTKGRLTPMMEAVRENRLSTLQTLLDQGADCTIKKDNSETSLHVSSWNGFRDVVRFLLKKVSETLDEERRKGFLDERNNNGKTALADAVHSGRPIIARMLLENGARYDIAKNNNETALHLACWNGRREAVAEVLAHASKDTDQDRFKRFLDSPNNQGKTALMDAAETNRGVIVEMLLDHGANYWIVNKKNKFTALHYCTFRNHMHPVRAILERASKDRTEDGQRFKRFLDQQGENGASALRDAARARHTEIALYLLQYGPEYETFDDFGRTPLHCAVHREDTRVALALVEYAKKDKDKEKFRRWVNAKKQDGATAVNIAREKKLEAVVKALSDTGVIG